MRRFGGAAFLAGLMILLIGLYYAVVKAGIPYQDPTPEMQISYAVNESIGAILLKLGLVLSVCGGILRLFLGYIFKP